jgi:hypothetical protein
LRYVWRAIKRLFGLASGRAAARREATV